MVSLDQDQFVDQSAEVIDKGTCLRYGAAAIHNISYQYESLWTIVLNQVQGSGATFFHTPGRQQCPLLAAIYLIAIV